MSTYLFSGSTEVHYFFPFHSLFKNHLTSAKLPFIYNFIFLWLPSRLNYSERKLFEIARELSIFYFKKYIIIRDALVHRSSFFS